MIDVHPDAEMLARAAASRIAAQAIETVAATGRFAIALAGGSTPRRTYELLAMPPHRDEVPWKSVHVYWGDERCVTPNDERSNERMARRALLDHVPIDENNIHPIRCAGDPIRAAAAYEAELEGEFGAARVPLDLVVLGVGEDGHTAGLFPGSPALDEVLRWTAVVRNDDEEYDRITTTIPLLNLAERAIFLVSGAAKADALRIVIAEKGGPERLPASRVVPREGEPIWMIDEAAAGTLVSRS